MDYINYLIQGGAVGISLALIYVVYQQMRATARNSELLTETLQKIAEDHRQTIDRNTDAWKANTEVLAKINERIR